MSPGDGMRHKLVEMLREYAVEHGDFVLASGKKSSYYIDVKKAYTRPEVLKEIIREIAGIIDRENFDRIAGVAVGAVPLATALSLEIGVPFLIIRKRGKGYGTGRLIEGEIKKGDRVLLIEDVTTTGGSALRAVKTIRDAGGVCREVITVVDRKEGAGELMEREGVTLRCLIKSEELIS